MRDVTIKDVARKLNVSISTVSRAFNDKYDIRPDTRKRILEVAKEMGYTPNPIAQHLCQLKSRLIGVVVPEFINAFFPRVVSGIQRELKEKGYQMLLMSSNENSEEEIENVKTLQRNRVDGLLISLAQGTRDICFLQEVNQHIPIVQFNRVSQKLKTSRVYFKDYEWSRRATMHLIEQGYRNIYYLCGPQSLILAQKRARGFVDVLKEHGVADAVSHTLDGGIFIEDGNKVVPAILELDPRPDAVLCFNDPLAIGLMKGLKQNGIRIPQDMAVMGFTESRIAMHTSPALSSIEQPAEEIGATAARLLLYQIEHEDKFEIQDVILDGKLNIRESTLSSLHHAQ